MVIEALLIVAALVAGFGLGRIKNKAKLAAMTDELNTLDTYTKKAVSAIKSKI